MTTIHFVRHGEVFNPQKVLYGRLPGYHLSSQGQQQAAAAGTYLQDRPLAALYCSPQLRAQETAAAIARLHPGLTIQTSPLLDEVHSPHQGRPLAELDAEGWLLYTRLPAGYETPDQIVERIVRLTGELRADHPGQEVAAVSHGDVILALRFWAEGIPFSDETKNRTRLYPATASITTLSFAPGLDRPQVTYHKPY